MKRLLRFSAALVVGIILLLSLLTGSGLVRIPITLLIGWFPSGVRLLNAWNPTSLSLVLVLLALSVLVTGSHAFLRWLFAALSNHQEPFRAWRWK